MTTTTTNIQPAINANPFEVFNHPDFGFVRVVMKDGEPWFVGKDVAETLGYKDAKGALAKHVDIEDKIMGSQINAPSIIDNLGREQHPIFINESGLYSLILRSKLPQAKAFKRWVTSEVLPSIRKHGGYLTPDKVEEVLLNPDTLINLALQLKKERQANERLQKDVDTLQNRIDETTVACLTRDRSKATCKDLLITAIAKMFDIKRKDFYDLLYNEGWLDNNNVDRKYYPTGKVPQGAMYVEVGAYMGCPKYTVRVTPYGLMCIKQLLREHGYILK